MENEQTLLGVNGYFGSDLVLLTYLALLIPLMLVGYGLVRRKQLRHHKTMMTVIVVSNWLPIGLIMLPSFVGGVAPALPTGLSDYFFLTPSFHALVGAAGQILASYLVLRLWFDRSQSTFLTIKSFKPLMQIALILLLLAAILGISTYAAWYLIAPDVPTSSEAAPKSGDNPLPRETLHFDIAGTGDGPILSSLC